MSCIQEGNTMAQKLGMSVLLMIVAVTAMSCATLFHGGSGQDASEATVQPPIASPSDHEAHLLSVVDKHLQSVREKSADDARLIRRKPYFNKEYAQYIGQVTGGDITMLKLESRTKPYRAEVRLNKQRFSTLLRRSKEEAREDQDFIRDTGTEILNYDLRGGRWYRTGSLFVAEKTEQYSNGQWRPYIKSQSTDFEMESTEAQKWYQKKWLGIFGRD
jgi:hypothetical protein